MKKLVIFTMGGKGGVGKTAFIVIYHIIQWTLRHDISC